MDKVSVIVPIYNAQDSLEVCLSSILSQTHKNLEVILVNDGSTDRSLLICKEYQKKDSRVLVLDIKNSGVSVARNIGMGASTGDFVCFVDADDKIDGRYIEKLFIYLECNQKNIVRCKYIKLSSRSMVRESTHCSTVTVENIVAGSIDTYVVLLMLRKTPAMKDVQFNSRIGILEDKLFYLNLIVAMGDIDIIDEYLYYYRHNESSSTKALENIESNIKGVIKAALLINKILSDINTAHIKRNNAVCMNIIIAYMYRYYLHNNKEFDSRYRELIMDDGYRSMMNNCNLSDLKILNKLQTMIFTTRRSLAVRAFFYARKVLSKLRTIGNKYS